MSVEQVKLRPTRQGPTHGLDIHFATKGLK